MFLVSFNKKQNVFENELHDMSLTRRAMRMLSKKKLFWAFVFRVEGLGGTTEKFVRFRGDENTRDLQSGGHG